MGEGLTTNGNSMKDILHTGDYLIFQECSRLKLGDIIRYRTENGWYAHRIVWIGIRNYYVAGDNSITIEKVRKGQISKQRAIFILKPTNRWFLIQRNYYQYILALYIICFVRLKANIIQNILVEEENNIYSWKKKYYIRTKKWRNWLQDKSVCLITKG